MSKTLKADLTELHKKKVRAEIVECVDEFVKWKGEAMTIAKLMSLCECEEGGDEPTMEEVGYLMVEKLEEMAKCVRHLHELALK